MSWRDLLAPEGETIVCPWVGGRSLWLADRGWRLKGDLPSAPGWYRFRLSGRNAELVGEAGAEPDALVSVVVGYLVGHRLVADHVHVDPDPAAIAEVCERVYLLDPALDRFARISAGRPAVGGPLVFREEEMPLGPEDDVLSAYLGARPTLDGIRGVCPALDAAFRIESWRREEANRRREALAQQRREAEAEARRQEILQDLGDGASRRALASRDFADAATAALAVGGATYLDDRRAPQAGERVVRFLLDGQRYECVCDQRTLRIIDAGICLTDHETDERGDDRFTLESLPGVIRQADREGALVVFRHVD